MGDDDRPPLSRRVPNENRGHMPAARVGVRQLPDEVVARMRAAVEAGAAAQAQEAEAPADGAAAVQVKSPQVITSPTAAPGTAEPDGAAAEAGARSSHKGSPARVSRKRPGHLVRPAGAKRKPAGQAAAATAQTEQVSPRLLPQRLRRPESEPDPDPDADTEQFAAIPADADGPPAVPADSRGQAAAPPASAPPAPPAAAPPAAAAPAPARPAAAAPAPSPAPAPDPRVPGRTARPAAIASPTTARRVPAASRRPAAGRRYRIVGAAAILAAIILAGSLTFVFRQAPASANLQASAAMTRRHAATWITSQVSRAALISCDPKMCRALTADHFPAAQVRPLRPGGSPLAATLVVATAAVRQLLGRQLAAGDAPGVIASFGAGASRIEVRLIAPQGAAAYYAALSADFKLRRLSGEEFLTSNRVGFSAQAVSRIAAGHVDARLLIMLTSLAADRPIEIVSFGAAAPGGSLDLSPYRSAVFEQVPNTPQIADSLFVNMMLASLRAQHLPQFQVASAEPLLLPDGQTGVRIRFAAPEPLGLLDGGSLPVSG